MTYREIREKFQKFFESKGHKLVPSASLVPENDSSVLFTTAGMQQFKPYYTGAMDVEKDFGSLNTASIQKAVRTSAIEEVGDESHLTFFEMLGNFSFGGYEKKEAIQYAHEFITKEMGLPIDYVSVFGGDSDVSADEESEKIWKEIDSNIKIEKYGKEDNFWGPTGEEGPCGPSTEIFVNGVEIWNLVFNEFYCSKDKKLEPLKMKGVDTGMGLERLAMVSQGKSNVYETDLFIATMDKIRELSPKDEEHSQRIIADHIRSAVFIISDGVFPSNTDKGYILRRLIRRAVRQADLVGMPRGSLAKVANVVINDYGNVYENLVTKGEEIRNEIQKEENSFIANLSKGLKQLEKLGNNISGKDAFDLYQSYGFPIEMTRGIVILEKGGSVDMEGYKEELKKHSELSTTASAGRFKGGLAGSGDMETKYHTATHLLFAVLRKILGEEVEQKGSNITPERLRFDFSYPQKLTDEEKQQVENLVNQKIGEGLDTSMQEVSVEEAKKMGAHGVFDKKYGDKVKVYKIGDFSLEICGGPHVKNTSELGEFKITKEESSSGGIRRIRAVLE
jgi:alanyl-tRNA synthetase